MLRPIRLGYCAPFSAGATSPACLRRQVKRPRSDDGDSPGCGKRSNDASRPARRWPCRPRTRDPGSRSRHPTPDRPHPSQGRPGLRRRLFGRTSRPCSARSSLGGCDEPSPSGSYPDCSSRPLGKPFPHFSALGAIYRASAEAARPSMNILTTTIQYRGRVTTSVP